MAFFNDPQRRVLPQVIEALQRLQEEPEQLALSRDQRYNEPPPPYSESGETTQPPTPGPPVVDKWYQRDLRMTARNKSTPYVQFKSQADRETKRILHQSGYLGRRQTLPWDDSLDYEANSENNVRSRWVEQGIWGDEWGPAWPKDSHPSCLSWRMQESEDGPFYGCNPTTKPGARWGHEESDPEPEPEPDPQPVQQPQSISGIFGLRASQLEQPKPPPRPIKYIQTPLGPLPQYPIPKPTVRNPEASRPYHQFLYQISKERDWIKDEVDLWTPGRVVDLDAMAYKSVKNNWIEDGIWNSEWGELPGMTWIHEEPEEEEAVEAPVASGPAGGQLPNAADDRQQPRARVFSFAPVPEANNDRTDNSSPPVAGGADVAERRTGRGRRKTSGRQPTATENAQGPEEGSSQSLRSARSSKVDKPRTIKDSSRKTRSGRITRNAAQSHGVARRGTQPRRSVPTPTESPIPNRRSTRFKEAADLSDEPDNSPLQEQSQPRRSRRLAHQPPKFGMLQQRRAPPVYESPLRRPSNTRKLSSSGPRSSGLSKKPTLVKGAKPQGIARSKPKGSAKQSRG